MTNSRPPFNRHLQAGAFAALTVAVFLACCEWLSLRLEKRAIHRVAPVMFNLKNQGIALQKAAFAQPDLLPLYGSSELAKNVPDQASLFFSSYPTGFSVFPIGKAGTTPLIILQKLGSVGAALKSKKVVISVSPSWFFHSNPNPRFYDGNFSPIQAEAFLFNTRLDLPLRQEAARRMLAFPETLSQRPLLDFAVRHLASGRLWDRCLLGASRGLTLLDQGVTSAQDHLETALYFFHGHLRPEPGRQPAALDWPRLLREATAMTPTAPGLDSDDQADAQGLDAQKSESFSAALEKSQEWGNLELLLRALKELGAKPLLLSMPIDGQYYAHLGVSEPARQAYYERLHQLAARYEMPLVDFKEHEWDPAFLVAHRDHLSVEGWMYFNQKLDAFFHHHRT